MCVPSCDIKCSSQPKYSIINGEVPKGKVTIFFLTLTSSVTMGQGIFPFPFSIPLLLKEKTNYCLRSLPVKILWGLDEGNRESRALKTGSIKGKFSCYFTGRTHTFHLPWALETSALTLRPGGFPTPSPDPPPPAGTHTTKTSLSLCTGSSKDCWQQMHLCQSHSITALARELILQNPDKASG